MGRIMPGAHRTKGAWSRDEKTEVSLCNSAQHRAARTTLEYRREGTC